MDETVSAAREDTVPRVRLIAFHLPQFHPIPENDRWWGKGFTEWTNVAKARPLFRGHHQPRVPADLGFYDLRLPETRHAQAELARSYGIEGFCYWHYWFHGRRLLERPVNDVLSSGEPDFPFCLGWANETWEMRWMGGPKQALVEQTYSAEDDWEHAQWLLRAFADPRYLKVDGRPLFLVYQPHKLPEPRRTTDILRDACERAGLPTPYLVGAGSPEIGIDMRTLGFDVTEFHEPHLLRLPLVTYDGPSKRRLLWNLKLGVPSRRLKLYHYNDWVELACARAEAVRDYPFLPCAVVRWDNSPRRGDLGIIMVGDTPDLFARYVQRCARWVGDRPASERIVFVNAWNEWAEGMYLEPDQQFGHAYLEALGSVATRRVAPRHFDPEVTGRGSPGRPLSG